MKPPAKKTLHKLAVDISNSDQFLGLVSPEADYKVSLLINEALGINLRSNSPVSKTIDKKEIRFSRFTSDSKFSEVAYELIRNRSGNNTLLNKIPSLDYILRIKEIPDNETLNNIIHKIRSIREITGVFILDKKKQVESSVLKILP
ncbi:MAG: IPExxxVDY family protein [Bacteroidales bacterium]|nr:IPExxxVDY family protein [Bacteroidales bacterium]